MEGQTERSEYCKILILFLIIYGIILFSIGIATKFIPDFREATRGIYVDPTHIVIWTVGNSIILWFKPNDEHTRVVILILALYYLISSILVFLGEFVWVVSEIRILYSFLFLIPISPLLLYVKITDFVKPDYTKEEYESLIQVEILKHPTIEEGLDYVLDYIDNPKWEFEEGYKEAFLEYLTERDDELGQLARARLRPDF